MKITVVGQQTVDDFTLDDPNAELLLDDGTAERDGGALEDELTQVRDRPPLRRPTLLGGLAGAPDPTSNLAQLIIKRSGLLHRSGTQ